MSDALSAAAVAMAEPFGKHSALLAEVERLRKENADKDARIAELKAAAAVKTQETEVETQATVVSAPVPGARKLDLTQFLKKKNEAPVANTTAAPVIENKTVEAPVANTTAAPVIENKKTSFAKAAANATLTPEQIAKRIAEKAQREEENKRREQEEADAAMARTLQESETGERIEKSNDDGFKPVTKTKFPKFIENGYPVFLNIINLLKTLKDSDHEYPENLFSKTQEEKDTLIKLDNQLKKLKKALELPDETIANGGEKTLGELKSYFLGEYTVNDVFETCTLTIHSKYKGTTEKEVVVLTEDGYDLFMEIGEVLDNKEHDMHKDTFRNGFLLGSIVNIHINTFE